ncbi:MAG: hypothetical protein Tsb0021_05310 [Chlamydiales bacterium]
MLPIFLFAIAIVCTLAHISLRQKWKHKNETFLLYTIFFNVGIMGLMAAYAHLFMGEKIAKEIGWLPGSPFQSEIAMANLSYGVLGILCLIFRKGFWSATVIGYSVLLIGALSVHLVQYQYGDIAPYNIGPFVWFNDLCIPIILLFSLYLYLKDA